MSNRSTNEASTQSYPCPRCRKPLIDPSGLGWCRACGYCKSLAEVPTESVPEPSAGPSNRFTATGEAMVQAPIWLWVSFGGMVVIAAATWVAGRYLTFTPFGRASFASLEIGIALLTMFLGQFIALMRIAPEEATLSFKDAFLPFKLYPMILKRLPACSFAIYTAAWGTAAVLSALIFIGGLSHWQTYLPVDKGAPKVVKNS